MEDLKPRAGLVQSVPEIAWGPLAAAAALGLLALIGALAGAPLLLPSLGPSVFLLALQPADPSTRAWNILAGHLIGLGAGALAAWITGALHAPPMNLSDPLPASRAAAAILAPTIMIAAQQALRAPHAPAAATALLFALGILPPGGRAAMLLIGAAAATALIGEALRRVRKGPALPSPLPRTPGET